MSRHRRFSRPCGSLLLAIRCLGAQRRRCSLRLQVRCDAIAEQALSIGDPGLRPRRRVGERSDGSSRSSVSPFRADVLHGSLAGGRRVSLALLPWVDSERAPHQRTMADAGPSWTPLVGCRSRLCDRLAINACGPIADARRSSISAHRVGVST